MLFRSAEEWVDVTVTPRTAISTERDQLARSNVLETVVETIQSQGSNGSIDEANAWHRARSQPSLGRPFEDQLDRSIVGDRIAGHGVDDAFRSSAQRDHALGNPRLAIGIG